MKIYLLLLLAVVTSLSYAVVNPTGKAWENLSLVTCSDGNEWTVCPPHLLSNTAPVISLEGGDVSYTEGDTYIELGATCTDTEDGAIVVPAPSFAPALDMNTAGTYVATYTCTDSGSLTDVATRNVYVNTPVSTPTLAFTDSTTTLVANDPVKSDTFGLSFVDIDADGYLDIFVTDHAEGSCGNAGRRFLISDGSTFATTLFDNDCTNFSQDTPTLPSSKSRYTFGNWCADSDGLPSFYGNDVDGSVGALYCRNTADSVNSSPTFQAKRAACDSAGTVCYPMDYNGDGNIDFLRNLQSQMGGNGGAAVKADNAGDDETRKIINPLDGSQLVAGVDDMWGSNALIFDVNNDTWPDIVYPYDRGWFRNDSGTGFTWQALTIADDQYLLSTDYNSSVNHSVVADFNKDGYMDFVVGKTPYNITASPGLPMIVYKNNGDGTFSNVSIGSGVYAGEIDATHGSFPWAQYANSTVADLDLDGSPEIIIAGAEYPNTTAIAQSNGNFTFSVDKLNLGSPHGGDCNVYVGKAWVTAGDVDRDGDIDLGVNGCTSLATNANVKVWTNTTTVSNNWFRFKFRGAGNNTDGLHTRVVIKEAGTNNIITSFQSGFFGQGQETYMQPHVGLGNNATVDVEITWPHGGQTHFYPSISTDKDLIAFRDGCLIENWTPGTGWPLTSVGQTCTNPTVAGAPVVNTTVVLTADASVTPTNSELVTFGLPFAEGEVTNIDEIVVKINSVEVGAYVEGTLLHHWSDNSIRSATIQLQNVDMTGGDVTVQITDEGSSVARLTEQAHSGGWTTAGADKNSLQFPRIFALHNKQYLADSGIIPPYDPAPDVDDAFETYQVGQFNNWAGGLNYSTSAGANWLFDRSSAMFKAYMTTARVEFLKEAFLSKQFYFGYVRNDGTAPAPAGGDGCWTYGGTACADGKYIAPQQAKLALALTGDDSQWDDSLLVEMALQNDLGWNQYGTRDTFDNENEGFTERGAGMAGLAEIAVYEMTADATILSHMNERITSLKDMQQTEKAWDTTNGWTPKSGGFTHNMGVHEGVYNEGNAPTGDTDNRGFSAWMSENIADFLWQAYHITGNTDIPEMLRLLGNAVETHGFTSTYNTTTDSYSRKTPFTGPDRTQACNTTGANTDHVYITSAYASDGQLASSDWWPYYSDNHNIETVLTLAAAYYFETNADNKEKLAARIAEIESGWVNASCATVFSNVYRLFNWQHRSNSIRTWKKILREDV